MRQSEVFDGMTTVAIDIFILLIPWGLWAWSVNNLLSGVPNTPSLYILTVLGWVGCLLLVPKVLLIRQNLIDV